MTKPLYLAVLCSSLLVSTVAATEDAAPTDDAIIHAAQQNDLAAVQDLLERGADPNARSQYGATPIFFAADKQNVEMVRVLLSAGAGVEVVDTFYGASPLRWSMFSLGEEPAAREIVLLMVGSLPEDGEPVDDLVSRAVEMDDVELVRAVVDRSRASDRALAAGLEVAEKAGNEAMASYLREVTPAEAVITRASLDDAAIARLVGQYRDVESGNAVEVTGTDGQLTLQFGTNPPMTLLPKDAATFDVEGEPQASVRFEPVDGPASRVVWIYGEREFPLDRYEPGAPTPETQVVATEPGPESSTIALPRRGPAKNWPEFRGPERSGNADGQGVPSTWDGAAGSNVAWTTEIPGLGVSSPIIWGDLVFVTTAVSEAGDTSLRTGLYGDVDSVNDDSVHAFEIWAVDRLTGEVAWKREASRAQPKVKRHLKSSHASPSPATDGRFVVASFGSEGLYAYDMKGELAWQHDLGVLSGGWFYDPTYEWEFASSPIIVGDTVVLQADVNNGSFIVAYDLATGEQRWRTERDEISSWGTPVVLPSADGPSEIVTNARTVRGYDADTGAELWRLAPNSEITVASPIVADGLSIVTGGYPPARPIYAIRPGGRGDLSPAEDGTAPPAIAWHEERGGTYIPTPLAYNGRLYVLHNNGRLGIYDVVSGETLSKARVGHNESFSASPIAADGRLFFTSEDGTTFVAAAAAELEILAENELGQSVMATPAASDGVLVVRGHERLVGIRSPDQASASPASSE